VRIMQDARGSEQLLRDVFQVLCHYETWKVISLNQQGFAPPPFMLHLQRGHRTDLWGFVESSYGEQKRPPSQKTTCSLVEHRVCSPFKVGLVLHHHQDVHPESRGLTFMNLRCGLQ
jgi:hypothetical protein